ncbi:MAG: hypothetical protein RR515_01210 [Clostridium sp.]
MDNLKKLLHLTNICYFLIGILSFYILLSLFLWTQHNIVPIDLRIVPSVILCIGILLIILSKKTKKPSKKISVILSTLLIMASFIGFFITTFIYDDYRYSVFTSPSKKHTLIAFESHGFMGDISASFYKREYIIFMSKIDCTNTFHLNGGVSLIQRDSHIIAQNKCKIIWLDDSTISIIYKTPSNEARTTLSLN